MERVELIRLQMDEAYRFVRDAVDGLTDEEFHWEPAPGCWSVRPNSGVNPPEFLRDTPNRRPWYIEDAWNGSTFETPDPPPLTTIGWLLVHVASCKVMYDEAAFGPGELTFDDLVVPTAAQAVALLEEGQNRLTRTLAGLSDEDLDRPRTYEGEPTVTWRLFWRLIHHDLTHGAEIARMRALHRTLHPPPDLADLVGDIDEDAGDIDEVVYGGEAFDGDRRPSARELGFDPWSLDFVANPYPAYAELRARAPVLYDEGTDHWLISRYDDVNRLLRDRRFGRTYLHSASHAEMGRPDDPPHLDPFWRLIRSGILDMEPPDHTRVRRLVSKAFTPRMVEGLRNRIQALVDGLVDRVLGAGEFDLVSEVAEPLPVAVIAEMLGVPEADRHLLRPWSAEICLMYELNPSEEYARRAVTASREFSDYLRALARMRRREPGEDLISALAQVLDDGERLTEDELVGTCVLLLNAGHEATVNVTANGWWALFRNPPQLARLRADGGGDGSVATAVEELMRYDTPLQMFERWVLEDVEVRGVRIPKGAELGLVFGSANHDPAAFDHPDELDVGRDPNPHLSFGAGIHFCLGAPLARLELETSFRTLLERAPGLEPVAEPEWKPGYIIRGLRELRVRA